MKKIIPNFIFILALLLTLYSLFFIKENKVFAINMDSSRFKIQFGNINIGSKDASSSTYKMTTTLGQDAAGMFTSQGYIVKAGFQYIHAIIPFTFTISNTNINFGTLNPNSPATSTTDLTISFGSAGSYQVTATEETPLKTMSNYVINDTDCNGGAQICDENTANNWNNNNTYGFGYQMTGVDIPPTYTSCQTTYGNNCYRKFPDKNSAEDPVVVMSNDNVTILSDPDPNIRNKHTSTVAFKVNISPLQNPGSYQNIIDFVATPGF